MSKNILIFNKPYHVLSQFTDSANRQHLGHFITEPGFYAAGRLDYDSEGLMLLTNDGKIQHKVAGGDTHKSYLIQVEGRIQARHLQQLRQGVKVKDYVARAIDAEALAKKPAWVWKRNPPIRVRQNIPTSWMMLTINQGKNRQVRRMSAAVGLPVLRLIRTQIGPYHIKQMQPGEYEMKKYADKQ